MELEMVTLASLRGGAAVEMFDAELQRVLDNIMDRNTVATAKREVTLKVVIIPGHDRGVAKVEIFCTPKLAPAMSCASQFYLGNDKGKAVAFEYDPQQLTMQLNTPTPAGVTMLRKEVVND